jgi:hypothetical protein
MVAGSYPRRLASLVVAARMQRAKGRGCVRPSNARHEPIIA